MAERLGVPAAAIITDRFRQTARTMAEVYGMHAYPFAIIAHPISNNTDAELRHKAEEALAQAVPMLRDR